MVIERERLNPAQKCAVNLIPNTRENHDVPESKQGFILMSPAIIQHNSRVLGKAVENSLSIKTGRGVMGGRVEYLGQVSVVLTLLSACFCNVSSSSLRAQPGGVCWKGREPAGMQIPESGIASGIWQLFQT